MYSVIVIITTTDNININTELDNAPELVNNDPYGKGWLIQVEPLNIKERDKLMNADEYQKFVG